MTTKSNAKNIILSFIVLILAAAVTYYADSPVTQSVAVVSDTVKI